MSLAKKTFRKTFNSVIALKAKEKVRPSPDAPEAKIQTSPSWFLHIPGPTASSLQTLKGQMGLYVGSQKLQASGDPLS